MSKAARSNLANGKLKERVADLADKRTLEQRLAEIVNELDKAQQAVAAAYAQMALDMVQDQLSPASRIKRYTRSATGQMQNKSGCPRGV